MRIIYPILAVALLFTSCSKFQKTKSGMAYKITKGGSSQKLKQGQIFKFNLEYKVSGKDTVLMSTYGHIPSYLIVDTSRFGRYNFTEIIPECAPGDKVEFVLKIDSLIRMHMIPDYNNTFKKGGSIKGRVEILAVFTDEKAANEDYLKEINSEKGREVADLKKYAKEKNIEVHDDDPTGVLYSIDNAGDGIKPDTSKVVTVIYTGYFTNGRVFDSNKDKPGAAPFKVMLGAHSVIPGWEEGLKHFAKGAKGKLLIPALLAYGPQGMPPVIGPFTNLIFDIEVTDVANKPAMPQAPAMEPNPVK